MLLELEEFESGGIRYIRGKDAGHRHLLSHLLNGAGACCFSVERDRVISLAAAHGWTVSVNELPKDNNATKPEADSDLVARAVSIARKAHAGQFRRDRVTPYITHPEAVAKSLEGEHPDVIATAWLHDVLEDTRTTVAHLKSAGIPQQVVNAVELLTRWDGQSYENYIQQIANNEIARKVKMADISHNLCDMPTTHQREKYARAFQILMTRTHD